jgi:NTP pyrophosphatase (non-canonical NTP hydrolase)
MSEVLDITKLKNRVSSFVNERDWGQFHSPKNIAMALSVESSEILEHFQWMTENDSRELSSETNNEVWSEVKDEVADVFVYLLRLSDLLNIDLQEAIDTKMEKNAKKYPVEKSRGTSKKYNKL